MLHILTGFLFITLGVLTRKYPWMLQNWRRANEKERELIDIQGLQTMYFRSAVVSGISLILVGGVNYFIAGTWSLYALIIILFVWAGYTLAQYRHYDTNPHANKNVLIAGIVLAVTMVVVVVLLAWGKQENEVYVDSHQLKIEGMYGETVALNTIDTLYMSTLQEIPDIELRTNGYSDGKVLKGYFRLTDWGSCKLIVHDIASPFIVIKHANSRLIINLKTTSKTLSLYKQLLQEDK